MLPTNWKITALGSILSTPLRNGYSPICSDVPNGRWVLSLGALGDESFQPSQKKPAPVDDSLVEKYLLSPGDFLISRSNTREAVGRVALFRGEIPNCSYPDLMMRFRVDVDLVDPDYLEVFLKSSHVVQQLRNCAAGTSGSMVKLNKSDVEQLPIFLPPIEEQRAIAQVLCRWKKAISIVDGLISKKQEHRTWLMQQLLTGEHRIPGFSAQWTKKPMSELVEPVQRRVPKPKHSYKALGIRSHCKGTFERIVDKPATVDMDELYVAKAGDLIVNITFAWEGAIAFVPPEHDGNLASHRFPMYVLKRSIDPTFLRYLVSQPKFIFTLGLISPGGAGRNRVMSKRDFLDIEVLVPSLAEQRKIGAALKLADEEIRLLSCKLKYLREQKKGLMQQLLTGKVRVKA